MRGPLGCFAPTCLRIARKFRDPRVPKISGVISTTKIWNSSQIWISFVIYLSGECQRVKYARNTNKLKNKCAYINDQNKIIQSTTQYNYLFYKFLYSSTWKIVCPLANSNVLSRFLPFLCKHIISVILSFKRIRFLFGLACMLRRYAFSRYERFSGLPRGMLRENLLTAVNRLERSDTNGLQRQPGCVYFSFSSTQQVTLRSNEERPIENPWDSSTPRGRVEY